MKKSNHTSGQWTSSEYSNNDWGVYSEEGDGRDIALVRGCKTKEESEANVRLITAAPEMLETLKEALDQLVSWNLESEPTFTMRRIESLIYKIENP